MKRVGVFNAPPVYVMGLSELLSTSGYALEEVDDPVAWIRRKGEDGAVLVGVNSESDLDIVVELKAEEPRSVVVTLIDDFDPDVVQASLRAGAAGSIPKRAGAAQVALAFSAAMMDNVVIPARVARAIVSNGESSPRRDPEDDLQVSWLRYLADGGTVVGLGERVGYSEREMYRRLNRLYSRLGVPDRTAALLKAARLGWLD